MEIGEEDLRKKHITRHQINLMRHYYGNQVRIHFLIGALVMITTLPFVRGFIRQPLFFSLLAIPILVIAAGLTNPKQISSAFLNVIISFLAIVIFEYYAIQGQKIGPLFFWSNQILAINFFFAMYFGMKTLRAELFGV